MKFDIVTIFPRMIDVVLAEGLIGKARERGIVDVQVHDLRGHTTDRHRSVDDVPYGGGPGMVMKPEPLLRAVESIRAERGAPDAVLLMSPQGATLSQEKARELSRLGHIVVLCGRYEGIDERVVSLVGAQELSIGDYVLSGGELPAVVVVEAVSRLLPGVVGDEQSVVEDSFWHGVLDHPHYTRPATFGGLQVPDVLLSGHHGEVRRWRRRAALARTLERRPDLLERAVLDEEERTLLAELRAERQTGRGDRE